MFIVKNGEFPFIPSAIFYCRGHRGDTIDYLGCLEANFSTSYWKQMFDTNDLLFVLPSTECHKRVPISTGSSITDIVITFLDVSYVRHASHSSKAVCHTTQPRKQVQSQHL